MQKKALNLAKEKQLKINDLMKSAMSNENIKKHSKEAASFAKKLVENLANRGSDELERLGETVDEIGYLQEAQEFLKSEYKCAVEVYSEDDDNIYDPKGKAKFAAPQRTAIFVE
jgi:leucyl-tRNA synthetase